MMRFTEIIENTQPLEPADYNLVAQQRDATRQQKAQAAQQTNQQQQQARQKQVWAKRAIAKPKTTKRTSKKKRATRTRSK